MAAEAAAAVAGNRAFWAARRREPRKPQLQWAIGPVSQQMRIRAGAVQLAGHGEDVNENTGAHQLAAARSVPHPTAIPGVMLAGNSTASGVFLASRKDIEFESGTQMQLGIVADR